MSERVIHSFGQSDRTLEVNQLVTDLQDAALDHQFSADNRVVVGQLFDEYLWEELPEVRTDHWGNAFSEDAADYAAFIDERTQILNDVQDILDKTPGLTESQS